MCLYQNECIYIKIHIKCTTRAQNFHQWKRNTCHTFLEVLKVVEIIYQNAFAYIKMNVMCAQEGQKCTKNFFF